MPFTSNADDSGASFRDAIREFGLDSPSRHGKSVGDRALTTVVDGICERFANKEGSDGRWPSNAPSTVYRKGRDDANCDTGAMGSREQIEGEQAISHNEATLDYGKDDECRAKAHWAHVGQSSLKIVRDFQFMSESDIDKVVDGVADDLLAWLQKG